MKTLIVAINSKFIHASLAVWYLKAACGEECGEVEVAEYTINDSVDSVFACIYETKADVVAFSCYIWNISFVLLVAENLKKMRPDMKIILGGPEVSFDGYRIMEENLFIDFILSGEGEETLKLLLGYLKSGTGDFHAISGLTYRLDGEIASVGGFPLIENLDGIPSPYSDEMLSRLDNRIVYYEASRGCPFSCSYCISSTFRGIRFFSFERVRRDLDKLIAAGISQVKFVDRTFNCSRQRAKEIFSYIIDRIYEIRLENPQFHMNFHFEAAADLFDEEMLEILSKSPKGFIQFEIGVQTTNADTHELVSRKTDLKKIFENVRKLKEPGNIHLHLDLIAGLPGEDFNSFINSFNEVYSLKPDQLQLGFLKLLKGSRIREEAQSHGYVFRSYPPYEILKNKYMDFDELQVIKRIEDVLERYGNSGRFIRTAEFIITSQYNNPFDFFYALAEYMNIKNYTGYKLSARQLYSILLEFAYANFKEGTDIELVKDLLKFDYLCKDNSGNLPDGLGRIILPGFKEACFEFLKKEENIRTCLETFQGVPAKQIYKQVHFEVFSHDVTSGKNNTPIDRKTTVVLFDYSRKDCVTGLYRHITLKDFGLIC